MRIGGSARCAAAGPANVADMRMTYGTAGQSLDEADVSGGGGLAGCLPAWLTACPAGLVPLLLLLLFPPPGQ